MIYKILSIIGFVFFSNFLLYHTFGATGMGVFLLGFYVFLACFYSTELRSSQKDSFIINGAILAVLFYTLLQRSNGVAQSIPLLLMWAIVLLTIYQHITGRSVIRSLLEYIMIPLRLLGNYLSSGIHVLDEMFRKQHNTESALGNFMAAIHKSKFFSLIVGLIISVPLIGLLLTFFSSADPIFSATIQKIFSQEFLSSIPFRIFFSVLLFFLLLPFLGMQLGKDFRSPLSFLERFNFVREASVVMSLVTITLVFFLIVQAPYVFVNVAAETDLSRYGVATYSEYVKRGFVELLQASILLYGITWLGLITLRGKKGGSATYLRAVQIIMVSLFLVFLISLFRRVWLYQAHHGWTLARMYGSFLLIWITGITLTLLLRHFITRRWSQIEAIFTVILVILIGSFNAEQFLVQNHPPTVNKRIDHIYLSRLSADGVEGWQESYSFARAVLQNPGGTEILNKDTRRSIAYAGVVVGNLLQQYDESVKTQGSDEDLYNYYITLFSYQLGRYDMLLERMGRYNQTDQALREAGISTDGKYSYNNYRNERNSLAKTVEALKERQQKKLPFEVSHMYYYINTTPTRLFTEYPEEIESFLITPEMFEGNREFFKVRSRDGLDRAYTFNFSNEEGFVFLKDRITLAELLRLQTNYFEYAQRIYAQPANERNFEADVSTNSPFLMFNQPVF